MKTISSRDNPDYRLLQRVLEGRRPPGERRHETIRAVLEGVHLCEGWLASGGQPELAFFDSERAGHPEIGTILGAVEASRARLCTPALWRSVSQVMQGQGVIFLVHAPRPALPVRIDHNCLWLDRLQDPGNMGTLLRTAAAAGMRRIYASKGCVGAWTPKVLRSAQGAHFVLEIHEGCDLAELRRRLDVPLLVTSLDDAVSLYDADLPPAAAWVFGNEGRGVAPELAAMADLRVRIPQDPAVESLNVGVAAGICLFEQRRRRFAGGASC
jgi:TrmH family RNA methyltransferase